MQDPVSHEALPAVYFESAHMLLTFISFTYLWDGRSLYTIGDASQELLDSLVSSIKLSFSKPSFPMLRELRDSLFQRNELVSAPYETVPTKIDLPQAIRRVGRKKLTDLEIAAILDAVASRHGLNSRIYCAVKYDRRTKDIYPFDLTPLYGIFAYGCYPIVVLDGVNILSPRRFHTITLLSDLVRFPQELFQTDAPPLLYQLRGFRCAFVESLEGNSEPSPQEFRILK